MSVVINIPDEETEEMTAAAVERKRKLFRLQHRTRSMSSFSTSTHQRYDESLLQRTVSDAGRWAYGTILVEVWVLNEDHTCLFRPECGWWIDPMFHRECNERCQICRLTDPRRKDFLPPEPLVPGEGLPGILWSEANTSLLHATRSGSGGNHRVPHRRVADAAHMMFNDAKPTRDISWRQIKSMAQDPNNMYNPRLQLLSELGLGWSAAVSFSLHGQQGIVVYMAREGVDLERLQSPSNEAYLMAASALAGAAYSIRAPRLQIVQERHQERAYSWHRLRARILALIEMGVDLETVVQQEYAKTQGFSSRVDDSFHHPAVWRRWIETAKHKSRSTLCKMRGGGSIPPPAFSWRQSAVTFLGVLVTLSLIARLNVYFSASLGEDFGIVLAPIAALATLTYGLTAAPAAQPKAALLGQTISMSIALALSYASDGMAIWLRQSFAVAVAAAVMVKLGICHPPAAASALVFSSSDRLGWGNMAMVLVANVLAIGCATVINNLTDSRQYPMYWAGKTLDGYMKKKRN